MTGFVPITTDTSWLGGWAAQYLDLLEAAIEDPEGHLADVLAHAADSELWTGYRAGRLSVSSVASWLLTARYVGDLFKLEEEASIVRHLTIVAAQSLEQTIRDRNHVGPTLAPLEVVVAATLNPQSIPALRRIVDYAFFAWREPRRVLVEDTPTTDLWLKRQRDLLPYLVFTLQLPTHERVQREGMAGSIVRRDEYIPDHDREPRPFYLRLFSEAERVGHDAEQKMIDESWANVIAARTAYYALSETPEPDPFRPYADEVHALCRAGAFLEARQRITVLQQTRLALPSGAADRLLTYIRDAKATALARKP